MKNRKKTYELPIIKLFILEQNDIVTASVSADERDKVDDMYSKPWWE